MGSATDIRSVASRGTPSRLESSSVGRLHGRVSGRRTARVGIEYRRVVPSFPEP